MANREYSSTDAAHNLPGFSSNAHWAEVQEGGAWSHNPAHLGPKDGFHDPIAAEPARQELPQDDLMHTPFPSTGRDDSVSNTLTGGTL